MGIKTDMRCGIMGIYEDIEKIIQVLDDNGIKLNEAERVMIWLNSPSCPLVSKYELEE